MRIKSIFTLKKYYTLIGINGEIIFLEFLSLLIPSILSIFSPVLSANVITAITVYDYNGAIFYLFLDFAIIIFTVFSYLIYHFISAKVNKITRKNLHEYIYNNIKNNQNVENINMMILDGIDLCAEFNTEFLYKLCFFIKSIILLIIILYYNLIISFILIIVSLISYFFFSLTNKNIKKVSKEYSSNQISSVNLFNNIKNGIEEEKNFNLETTLKNKYFDLVNKNSNCSNKIKKYYFFNNNLITFILKAAVFGLTTYLILLVKSTTLTLSLYLILTPYLTSSAQNLIAFFEIFSKIGELDNTLLEFESLNSNSNEQHIDKYIADNFSLRFYHIKFDSNKNDKILNFDIDFGKSAIIIDQNNDKNSYLWSLLQRKYNAKTGGVFLGEKNIFEFDLETYKKIITFVNKTPYFFNVSIMENLFMVCENKSKIKKEIKNFGLEQKINNLEDKLNTIFEIKQTISSTGETENFCTEKDKTLLFFLGILRAFLSDPKIIVIYEIPELVNELDITIFRTIVKYLKNKITLILFSKKDYHQDLFDYKFNLK